VRRKRERIASAGVFDLEGQIWTPITLAIILVLIVISWRSRR
jgi:hypothetical protein